MTLQEAYSGDYTTHVRVPTAGDLIRACREHIRSNARQVVVACGGYRWNLYLLDDGLGFIEPRARSVKHFLFALIPECAHDHGLRIGEYEYDFDPRITRRVYQALLTLLAAWTEAHGDLNAFYRALGQSGSCAICGAALTDALSMARGIGPECYRHIGVGMAGVREVVKQRISR